MSGRAKAGQSIKSLTVPTTVDVKAERIIDLLVSAFEGGIGYWARVKNYDYGGKFTASFKKGGDYFYPITQMSNDPIPPYAVLPLVNGCGVILEDAEEKTGESPEWRLDRPAIEKGMKLMAQRFPKSFADFVAEDEDANTGDVFVQCCVLHDEIVKQHERTGKWMPIYG